MISTNGLSPLALAIEAKSNSCITHLLGARADVHAVSTVSFFNLDLNLIDALFNC